MKLIHRPLLSKFDFFLFRTQGPGFGNLLFPLYRAYQGSKQYGGELIFPQFRQIKLGTYLRNEKDKRTYGDIFASRSLRDLTLQARSLISEKTTEEEFTTNNPHWHTKFTTVEYSGLKNYFKDLNPENRSEFSQYLINRATEKNHLLARIQEIKNNNEIAIHLRLGDFKTITPGTKEATFMNARTDIDWYGDNIRNLQKEDSTLKFTLFTDEADLPEEYLEKLGNPIVDKSKNALEAILCMAHHRTIIGSKSSFSMWAAFLGNSELRVPHDFTIEKYTTSREINYVAI